MTEIKAKEGMFLTQSADVPKEERIFATAVYTHDTSMWREATLKEKEEAKNI